MVYVSQPSRQTRLPKEVEGSDEAQESYPHLVARQK